MLTTSSAPACPPGWARVHAGLITIVVRITIASIVDWNCLLVALLGVAVLWMRMRSPRRSCGVLTDSFTDYELIMHLVGALAQTLFLVTATRIPTASAPPGPAWRLGVATLRARAAAHPAVSAPYGIVR